MSLRELARKVKAASHSSVSVSPSYLSRLERGYDALISPEILYGLKEALGLANEEVLPNLTERNYARFSNFLRVKKKQYLDLLCPADKDEEWRDFLERAHKISGKILEPLLTDLVERGHLPDALVPQTWPETFWRGESYIEDMAETMASLFEVYMVLQATSDRVAVGARTAIEDALGYDYIDRRSKQIRNRKKSPSR